MLHPVDEPVKVKKKKKKKRKKRKRRRRRKKTMVEKVGEGDNSAD